MPVLMDTIAHQHTFLPYHFAWTRPNPYTFFDTERRYGPGLSRAETFYQSWCGEPGFAGAIHPGRAKDLAADAGVA